MTDQPQSPYPATLVDTITSCPRCGGDHGEMTATRLTYPLRAQPYDYSHWVMCPTTGEPIMIAAMMAVPFKDGVDIAKALEGGMLDVFRAPQLKGRAVYTHQAMSATFTNWLAKLSEVYGQFHPTTLQDVEAHFLDLLASKIMMAESITRAQAVSLVHQMRSTWYSPGFKAQLEALDAAAGDRPITKLDELKETLERLGLMAEELRALAQLLSEVTGDTGPERSLRVIMGGSVGRIAERVETERSWAITYLRKIEEIDQ